jgi:ribose/xylose/arabinose/galactoside ABC-type transport system permease subunit
MSSPEAPPALLGSDPATSSEDQVRRARPGVLRGAELQLLLGTAILYAAFAIPYTAKFATGTNTLNMAEQGSILLVVALAQMFALLIGGFDISVAANMGFVSVVSALLMTDYALSIPLAIILGLGAGAAVGVVNGIMIAVLDINPFAATLGMLAFLLGFGNVLSHGASVGGLPEDFSYFGAADWGPMPSAIGIAAIALTLCWVVLRRMRAGLYIYGIGGSVRTARLAGLPVRRYEVLAYTLCGTLAGLAGLIVAARLSVGQAELGGGYDLLSIATAVIGGTVIGGGVGRLGGIVLGAALIQVLNTGMDIAGVGEYQHRMVTGAVIVVAAVIGRVRGTGARNLLRALSRAATTATRPIAHR